MFQDIKAAIFDMDGTLIDSMWVWEKIDIDYLKKRNIPVPKNLSESIAHLTFEESAQYFKNKFNLKDNIKTIMDEWNNMAYYEYVHNVKLKNGALDFLMLLKNKGIKLGLATSNCDMLLKIALKNNGIYDIFDCITTSDEVNKSKEFPDIYLLCAERLNISPKHCIVFEDILPAIRGAKSAGMKVVGVHDMSAKNQKKEIIKNADFYILEYNELIKAV
ncbi:haloacid dehalogenase [Clostridium tetani]|uniref:Putative phosphatase n=1 Tax=Clostridium tetani (strain Massachusetts / E88) TaxID=212717 RepID=Q899J3_CLOTE|nr:HAD family phosphatase [Clostridium tetani]AAO34833.1 putative phosphatase [Clostridium tetani E88]AVP55933.1 HAD family phosphatase [Clostridium tetani]KGI38793.1 HAD family hydrolase [Clostridium tetani ATCC 9441]KGI40676.1 HAD family hydrolase [Clostridium tetani]KGI43513.1 HAD family hydrolase [Clostridium tetani]